ncbi:MAG: LysM peptidoglycan-binding domain-containing protein [Verrucomicrobiota bacterium]
MTVRRTLCAAFALGVLLLGAGCSDRDSVPTISEIDEPLYVQGLQLKRQGRYPEALTAFLKVIDKRGARSAPESHVEAGVIFLDHAKDPIYASYHFRRYLELQPNSKQAEFVRGKVTAAKREFARSIPGRPMEDQSVRMQSDDEVATLRRENAELRAELATLRGGGAMPVPRAPRMITVPEEALTPSAVLPPVATVVDAPPASTPVRPAMPADRPPPPGVQVQAPAPSPVATPAPKPAPPRPAPAAAGRTHLVAQKDTLYGISVKYYGNGRQVEAIYQANRDVMKDRTDVRPGMTLKLPAGEGRR